MQGLQDLGLSVTFAAGCTQVACPTISGFSEVTKLVEDRSIEAIIAVIGLDESQER